MIEFSARPFFEISETESNAKVELSEKNYIKIFVYKYKEI